jgi:hypothetical protein
MRPVPLQDQEMSMRPMNKYAADVAAEDFVLFDGVLEAEIERAQAIGDGELARRLIAVGAWIAEEWLRLAEDRATLARQLLSGPQLTDDP